MTRNSLLQPQEIEVYYIIPTLRRELAYYMKLQGLKQNKIAELLHVEGASISQYLHEKRGNKIELDDNTKKEISHSAEHIKDPISFVTEMQRLLRLIRERGVLCKIHKQLSSIPQHCNPCLVNCFGDKNGNARICN